MRMEKKFPSFNCVKVNSIQGTLISFLKQVINLRRLAIDFIGCLFPMLFRLLMLSFLSFARRKIFLFFPSVGGWGGRRHPLAVSLSVEWNNWNQTEAETAEFCLLWSFVRIMRTAAGESVVFLVTRDDRSNEDADSSHERDHRDCRVSHVRTVSIGFSGDLRRGGSGSFRVKRLDYHGIFGWFLQEVNDVLEVPLLRTVVTLTVHGLDLFTRVGRGGSADGDRTGGSYSKARFNDFVTKQDVHCFICKWL